jgi:hypothetical protein
MSELCRQFEAQLDGFVGSTLADDQQRSLQAHVASCAHCAALLAVVLDSPTEPREDLVGTVLTATSGSACRQSQTLLCDWIDARLADVDNALLVDHLHHCTACTQLATALRRLRVDLPLLVTHRTDADFVGDVLRSTSAAPAQRAAAGLRQRLAQAWASLSQRPRFAWEVAWVGTAVLLLLVGTPQSPLRDVPQSALAIVQTDPTSAWRSLQQPMERTWGWVRDDVEGIWEETGRRLVDKVDTRRAQWLDEHPQATHSWQSLQQRLPTLRRTIADGNLAQASWVLTNMGNDIKNLWHGLRADPAETPGPPTQREETP